MILATGRRAFRAGVALIAGMAAVVLLAGAINASFGLPFNLNLGFPPGFDYSLRADFKDANGLAQGAAVVMAGNPVGQVTTVLVQGQVSEVDMRIDRQYAPVHTGTLARIRYGTLLAAKYVELSSIGAGSKALPSGALLPTDQTVTPVDFDQFLTALDPTTRKRLQVVIQQAGGGVDGEGAAINDLFGDLRPLSQESTAPLDTFRAHDADLDRIVHNLATVSNRLAQSHEQLGGFVQNTGTVTGTLDSRDRQLDDLLLHLGNSMQDFDQTLNGEEGNFHSSIVQFDPASTQLNGVVYGTYSNLHPNLGLLEKGIKDLTLEIGGAVNTSDANGNFLRQYLVQDNCFSSYEKSKSCSTTSAPASKPGTSGGVTSPVPAPTPCVTVSPTGLPLPLPSPSPTCTSGLSTNSSTDSSSGLGGLLNQITSSVGGWLGGLLQN